MSLQGQGQVIYRADDNSIKEMQGLKNKVHQLGNQYANHKVRVQTLDGITYEGRLSHMDGDHMFIIIPGHGMHGHHDGHHDGHGHHGGHHWNWGHDGQHHHGGYPMPGHHGGQGHHGQQYPGLGQQGHHPQYRAFFGGPSFGGPGFGSPGFNDVIIPLVLYNLLVISLL